MIPQTNLRIDLNFLGLPTATPSVSSVCDRSVKRYAKEQNANESRYVLPTLTINYQLISCASKFLPPGPTNFPPLNFVNNSAFAIIVNNTGRFVHASFASGGRGNHRIGPAVIPQNNADLVYGSFCEAKREP